MKIETPDFISKHIDNFYKEDQLEKEKLAKALLAKAKRNNKLSRRNDKMGT